MEPGKQRTFRFDEVIREINKPGLNKKKLQLFCVEAGLITPARGGGFIASEKSIKQKIMRTGYTDKNGKPRPFVFINRKGINHLRRLIHEHPKLKIRKSGQLKIPFDYLSE